jgi:crotonobetainyl-CoA:carnitine CoA-transferase CaiB-like acyl-CoA transferase
MTQSGPLAGVRVVDLAQFVAGSYCTMLLGDLGADVLKVEIPGAGDPYRRQGPEFVGGEATLFLALNRNKRGVTIDWKQPAGLDALLRLIAGADIFVENARPGSLAKYGLDYAALSEGNPRLIYGSISGYGQTGPYAGRGGFDLILQGEGGLMAITGERAGPPVKVGAPVLDVGAALSCVAGMLAALHRRDATGTGGYVESSLLDFSLAALCTVAQSYFASGVEPERMGSASPMFAPYQAFNAGDGYITVAGAGNESLWQRACQAMGRADLIDDPRFRTNADRVQHQDELVAIIETTLATRPRGHWQQAFEAAGVPAGPINGLADLFADPHLRERGAVLTIHHPSAGELPAVSAPVRMDGSTAYSNQPPPRLGEHTEDALRDAGLSAAEIAALREQGVLG